MSWVSLPGLNEHWSALAASAGATSSQLGRIVAEHRGRWQVVTEGGERAAAVAGTVRSAIQDGAVDRPAVGDWVVLREPGGATELAQIERVLPRATCLSRRSAGRVAREQVVAANIDQVLIVCALGRDVNERRLERFAAVALASGAGVAIILSKSDLVDDPAPYLERVRTVAPQLPIHVVSTVSGRGMDELSPYLASGRTLVMLGTSGAGKSTLVNAWLTRETLSTATLGVSGKGRHTTTSRQMIELPSGAYVIDTPGVREVGLWAADEGLSETFSDLAAHAAACRFSDCQHEAEPGCAVRAAVASGDLDPDRLGSWQRLRKEQTHQMKENDAVVARRSKQSDRSATRALRQRLREKRR